ncbi:hypothetical protein ACH5RR_041024 [Cinchona calisaya]|uniref:Uncharacterized protein n=1 Tax=Cinchona calisaya TaxID=153742 RepID=A0ABD2XVE1_9GENT
MEFCEEYAGYRFQCGCFAIRMKLHATIVDDNHANFQAFKIQQIPQQVDWSDSLTDLDAIAQDSPVLASFVYAKAQLLTARIMGGLLVQWVAPREGSFKRNVDSSSLSSSQVLLDSFGSIVLASANTYDLATNMIAESRTLLDDGEL